MKFVKWTLGAFGALALLVSAWFLFQSWVGIGKMMAVAVSNRSAEFPSPMNHVYLAVAVGLLAGFLLGLALALPLGRRRKPEPAPEPGAAPRRMAEVPDEAERATDQV